MSFNQANIRLENMDHHGIKRVALVFAYFRKLIAMVNQTSGSAQPKICQLSLRRTCSKHQRRSSLVELKPNHVGLRPYLLHIENDKGKKDRVLPLSDKLFAKLREYYRAWKPQVWLFEEQKVGKQNSEKSLLRVLNLALTKMKNAKPETLHWLRNSYAL